MRKMMSAAVIGLTALGSAVIVGGAQAQPYGYYSPAPSGYYDADGYYHNGTTYNGYYTAPSYGYAAPNYGYYNNSGAGLAGALIGSLVDPSYGRGVPVDRYGPDPNGMIAPDGHRIKCKLRTGYDYGRYRTYRECH